MPQEVWDANSRKSQHIREGFTEEVTSELVLMVEYRCVKWRSRVAERTAHMCQENVSLCVSYEGP